MKWKQLLLKVAIGLLAIFIVINTYKPFTHNEVEPVKIIDRQEKVADSHYIISESMILGKLQAKSEIVSVEQPIKDSYTDVDESWLGNRETTLEVSGTYKAGLNTKDIKILHMDSVEGILYIQLPQPTLISLELPYDQVEIEKTKGWLRLAANEEEEKQFYRAVENDIRNKLMNDEEILEQVNINNQRVIEELLTEIDGIKHIVFKGSESK